MPRVDFYLSAQQPRQVFACKLIEKAWRNGSKIAVLTDSESQSAQFDTLLWTFRPGSFIPHQIVGGELPQRDNVILISHQSLPDNWADIIVNLSSDCPTKSVGRILEILDSNEDIKQAGRQRYRQYQQQGFELSTHHID